MAHRIKLFFVVVICLILLALNNSVGGLSVGVKKGDWIEYHVTTTGTPEEGHDVTWARMEILGVEGTQISVNITTKARNGTFWSEVEEFDPASGNVGVWFLIPANLNTGEVFFDSSLGRNVTIEGFEQRSIAGAERTITHSSTPERIKSWDKTTGVFVETVDVLQNTTLYAIADKTNMWTPQVFKGESSALLYVVFGFAALEAVVIIVLAITMIRYRPKSRKQ